MVWSILCPRLLSDFGLLLGIFFFVGGLFLLSLFVVIGMPVVNNCCHVFLLLLIWLNNDTYLGHVWKKNIAYESLSDVYGPSYLSFVTFSCSALCKVSDSRLYIKIFRYFAVVGGIWEIGWKCILLYLAPSLAFLWDTYADTGGPLEAATDSILHSLLLICLFSFYFLITFSFFLVFVLNALFIYYLI